MITNLQIGSYGRLGNQLFQFATAFNLAKKLNTELLISEESEYQKTSGRFNPSSNSWDSYSNDLFRLFDLKFAKKEKKAKIQEQVKNYYKENDRVCFYPEVFNQPDGTNLHGYFQGKEYVDLFEKELREELRFNSFYSDYGQSELEKFKKDYDKVVSLHIRRGDCLNDNFTIYAELSLETYYKKIISERVGKNDLILVFSDDLEWCTDNLKDDRIIQVDNRNKEHGHLMDFSLMSMCDTNIMAVSTYSWWACWMKPNAEQKEVIMPNKWWGTSLTNFCEEIYRYDNWIKYENK